MSEEGSQPVPESGRVYRTVTRYWPRIAAGLVGLGVLLDFALGNLSAGGSLEFYVFAWASTTGGLWFLFERAEKALGAESRAKVTGWLRETDLRSGIESIPTQFVFLFDRVFGEKHLSRFCLNRSCAASLGAFLTVVLLKGATGWDMGVQGPMDFLVLLLFAGLLNFLPDYVSLLQTRWVIGRLHHRAGRGIVAYLLGDLAATVFISLVALLAINAATGFLGPPLENRIGIDAQTAEAIRQAPDDRSLELSNDLREGWEAHVADVSLMARGVVDPESLGPGEGYPPFVHFYQVSFLSAFFTSVWLWLYVVSVPLSRALVRMNSGVGFLLRVTDVEKQPFRSMGFVSVIITSVLFALGLPLVLL